MAFGSRLKEIPMAIDEPWAQLELWEDDRFRCDVRFCRHHGWEWEVHHYFNRSWCVLDSGLAPSVRTALSQLQRVLGELAG